MEGRVRPCKKNALPVFVLLFRRLCSPEREAGNNCLFFIIYISLYGRTVILSGFRKAAGIAAGFSESEHIFYDGGSKETAAHDRKPFQEIEEAYAAVCRDITNDLAGLAIDGKMIV